MSLRHIRLSVTSALLFFAIFFLSTSACAAGPSANEILASFRTDTNATYTVTDIQGIALIRPAGATAFTAVAKTPFAIKRDTTIFIYPLSTVTVSLNAKSSIVIENEACITLDDIFNNRKVGSVRAEETPEGVLIFLKPSRPTIFEKRTVSPGVTDIRVTEGRVWVAELDRYGERAKKEIILNAGESMTVASDAAAASGTSASPAPPSVTPGPQTKTETAEHAPAPLWSKTYDSGMGADIAMGVCTDSADNVIITGTSDFGAAIAPITTIKYSAATGDVLWQASYSGAPLNLCNQSNAVAVDSDNNVIIVGATGTNAGVAVLNYLIVKYRAEDGLKLWEKTVDLGGNDDMAYGVAVDTTNDDIIVTGQGNNNYYTVKYDTDGNKLWDATYDSGGANPDRGTTVSIDEVRNIIVSGIADGPSGYGSGYSATLKYSSTGTELWRTTYDNGFPQEGTGIIPSSRYIYAALAYKSGSTIHYLLLQYDTNGNLLSQTETPNAVVNLTSSGKWIADTRVTIAGLDYGRFAFKKYSPDFAKEIWGYSSGADDQAFDFAFDRSGNIILTGESVAGDFLTVKYAPSVTSTLTKSVNRKEAVIGDILTYSIIVHNPKPGVMTGITLHDRLPPGFTYVKGSSVYDGARISDPSGTRTLTYNLGGLLANAQKTLSYQLIVGAGCIPGEYYNEATATGTFGGTYTFNTTHAIVKVVLDPILQKGTIVGTVYWDHNENGIQEKGEEGIQGVKVYLEDGTSVATDKYGRYHFQGVNPGTHTVKIDKSSIKERL